jgi:integrase/recombinase XerD
MAVNLLDQKLARLKKLYKKGKPKSELDLIISYVRYRRAENLSSDTILNDLKALIELSKVINKPIKELTESDVYDFFDHLNSRSISTAALYKIKIKGFFKFIGREDLAMLCKVKRSSSNKKLPEDLLNPEDIEHLIDSAQSLRDKAYIAVLYESGARRGELQEIQIKHIHFDENGAVITLPKGKTGARRIRIVYAAGYLRNWLENHPLKNNRDAWVWVSSRDETKVAEYRTLWGNLQRIAERASIEKRVNPHSFRHARATHLAKDLTEQQLKVYLGWTAGSTMAAVYVHLSGKDLDQAILKLHGLATDEMKEDNALKTLKCPRCKEIQDKKALFCFKCGLPLNRKFEYQIDADFKEASAKVIDFNDPEVKDQLLKFLTENQQVKT